ncbi:MAG: recombinase family protein [Bacillota bacterium]
MNRSKAILYMRLSSTDGQNESESIANQRQLLHAFVKERDDIDIVGEAVDDGFTGTNFNRPGFQSTIKEAVLGNIDCIIVKDLSRLGRDYIETGFYLRNFFPQYNIRFIAVNDNIDTDIENDLGSQIDVTLKTILNDCYSADISKKTRASLATKRKNGQFLGSTAIYGYKKEENSYKLHLDPYPAEVIKFIFSLHQNGTNVKAIAEELNDRCIASPLCYKKENQITYPSQCFGARTDCFWSPTTIRRILTDETYTGTLLQGKQTTYSNKLKKVCHKNRSEWAITPDAHTPIITQESFDFTQKLLKLETRTPPKKARLHLFSGLIYCSCCGKQMTRKTVPYQNKKYFYYCCTTGRKNGCTTKMIRETTLISCVKKVLDIYEDLTYLKPLPSCDIATKLYCECTNLRIENELNLKKMYLDSLEKALTDGLISKEEYENYIFYYIDKINILRNAKEKSLKDPMSEIVFSERKRLVQNLSQIAIESNRIVLSFYEV